MSPSHPSSRTQSEGAAAPPPLSTAEGPQPVVLTERVLRGWPLPQPAAEGDKEERGRVLVVGGSPEMPGAILLAATAALRAGAGKLRIATGASIAQLVAAAVPEARVFSLPETESGALAASAAEKVAEYANHVQAVLIGPGMVDEDEVSRLVQGTLPLIENAVVILDAAALACVKEDQEVLHPLGGKAVVTPHAGEMASMLGTPKETVREDPLATARRATAEWNAVVLGFLGAALGGRAGGAGDGAARDTAVLARSA